MDPFQASRPVHSQLSSLSIPRGSGKTTWEPTSSSTPTATPCFHAKILGSEPPPGTPQIQREYGAMDPLLAYTLALMLLPAFCIPKGSGKATWEPTSTAAPCFRAELSGSERPSTPQIQREYGAMDPLLAYTPALMHLPAFCIPRGSGKAAWDQPSTSTSTAAPCFRAELSGSEPPGTPQIQQGYDAMNPLLAYALAPMHLPAFHIPRGSGRNKMGTNILLNSHRNTLLDYRAEILGSD
ncbi:hypothetical protein THAOC_01855 [Thalassiosira oceanica]|uniref:Uncharacterized protein n=1 Tax=Thalassiosira oceanica TaxID=159749 RepID=K0TMN6_THAOC|nr:hypothetical protein THAOC_01855 [Thalassiosira oceanica]|eukprot:EJK76386.1 hypothetical protein THAOC_01855 [Thalassiosira oceanica]